MKWHTITAMHIHSGRGYISKERQRLSPPKGAGVPYKMTKDNTRSAPMIPLQNSETLGVCLTMTDVLSHTLGAHIYASRDLEVEHVATDGLVSLHSPAPLPRGDMW